MEAATLLRLLKFYELDESLRDAQTYQTNEISILQILITLWNITLYDILGPKRDHFAFDHWLNF